MTGVMIQTLQLVKIEQSFFLTDLKKPYFYRYGRSEQEWPLYAKALEQSDEALILDVYSAEETPLRLTSAQIAGRISEHLHARGHQARYDSWDNILSYLRQTASQGDLILTIGAGSVSRLGRLLAAQKEAV